MEVCDRYAVLRNGILVSEGNIADVTVEQIACHMIGHAVDTNRVHCRTQYGEEVLRLDHLSDGQHFFEISSIKWNVMFTNLHYRI